MTFLSGTPLDCTIHPALWTIAAKNKTYTDLPFASDSISSQDMV